MKTWVLQKYRPVWIAAESLYDKISSMPSLGSKDLSLDFLLLACPLGWIGATQISGRSCEVKCPNEGMHPCNHYLQAKHSYGKISIRSPVWLKLITCCFLQGRSHILLLSLVCYLDCKLFWAASSFSIFKWASSSRVFYLTTSGQWGLVSSWFF